MALLARLRLALPCLVLAACAPYQPLLLDPAPAPAPAALDLSMDGAVALAIRQGPDLAVARANAALARAQAGNAALLPDPTLALSRDLAVSGGSDLSPARSFGLSYDINTLLSHPALARAGAADQTQARLALQWQAWELAAKVRASYIKLAAAQATLDLLRQQDLALADQVGRLQEALRRQLVTTDQLIPQAAAWQDVRAKEADAAKQVNQQRHDFATLLGLAGATRWTLQPPPRFTAPSPDTIAAARATLARQRPDLAALRAGYTAEDQRYRAALLAQFPQLNVGFTRARDTGGIASTTLGISIALPVFNGNRGAIRVEEATRAKLQAEYRQQLVQVDNEIDRLQAEAALTLRERDRVRAELPQAERLAHDTRQAAAQRLVDSIAAATAAGTLLAKQLELITLEDALQEQNLALAAMLGLPPAPVRTTP